MSDTNQSSNLASGTQAEVNSEQQAGAQLEQERERLRAIANAYRECEARLQLTREQIEQLIGSSTPTNTAPATTNVTSGAGDAAVQNIFELLNQLAVDPFALLKPTDANSPQAETLAPTGPEAQGAAADDLNQALFQPGGADIAPFATDANADTSTRPSTAPAGAGILVPPAIPPTAVAGQDFSTGVDLQTQALLASGERLRNALEQSMQSTASLFEQMLALIENQNRKLGQVDQKISELSGQLQSLKNP